MGKGLISDFDNNIGDKDYFIDNRSRITTNLAFLIDNAKITSVDLATTIGLSAELIGKLRNGHLTNPTLRVLSRLSAYFNVPVHDLIFAKIGHGYSEHGLAQHLPHVAWENILNWKQQQMKVFAGIDYVFNSVSTFALQVNGYEDSIPNDSVVFVDTSVKPVHNQLVLLLSKKMNEFSIRRFISEDTWYLQSLKLDSSVISYDENLHGIFGTILGFQNTKLYV